MKNGLRDRVSSDPLTPHDGCRMRINEFPSGLWRVAGYGGGTAATAAIAAIAAGERDLQACCSPQSFVRPQGGALWFCYSPVYQMTEYYRAGTFDNCWSKWTELFDCLSLKTKPADQLQVILEEREREKLHIWKFQTPEEASKHWKEEFGHLQD